MTNKDLILQYVDTGLKLPKHQVDNLPSWAMKTYIRKRIIAIKQTTGALEGYELVHAPEQMQRDVVMKIVKTMWNDDFLEGITPTRFDELIEWNHNNDAVINMFLRYPEFVKVMNKNMIIALMEHTTEPERIMQLVGDEKMELVFEYYDHLWWTNFLVYSLVPAKMMKLMGTERASQAVQEIDSIELLRAFNPYELVNAMGERGVQLMTIIKNHKIDQALHNSNDPEGFKKLFDQFGIDYR